MQYLFKNREKEPDEIGNTPRGLCNVGNTCYFNSVIQPLCHTHSLYSELWNARQDGDLALSYMTVCHSMRNGAIKAFAPSEVRNQFVTRVSRFNNRRQHDSHECLRHFLDEIRKEERSSSSRLLTVVDKVFGGHLVTVYVCQECDKHHHLFEPCLDISLPVFFEAEKNTTNEVLSCGSNNKAGQGREHVNSGRTDDNVTAKDGGDRCTDEHQKHHEAKLNKSENEDRREGEANDYKTTISKLTQRLSSAPSVHFSVPSIRNSTNSLNDCLKHFSRVEQINEEYLCEDCLREAMARGEASEDNLKLTSATKQTLIFNPPAILTIHFKRFELLPGRSRKRSDMVEYPQYLDIAPYCSSQCLRNDPPRNNIWYSLYAVVVHSGSLDSGHYKAYVKVREKYESIEVLNRFIQQEYFNHNVTSDELMQMLTANRTQKKTGENSSKREESNWFLINDSSVRRVSIDSVLKQEAYLLFYERMKGRDPLVEIKRPLKNVTVSHCKKDNWIDRDWKYTSENSNELEDILKRINNPFGGQMSVAM